MIVTIDFETYYEFRKKGGSYTLKKMATSEYIRHEKFEILTCSIKIDNQPTKCYVGGEIEPALRKIDWSAVTLLAHHVQFDGFVLYHKYGIVPRRYACTLSMGRALHPKDKKQDLGTMAIQYGLENKLPKPDFANKRLVELTPDELQDTIAYNIRDVDVCYGLYLKMLPKVPVEEMDLIDITCRMFCDPVLRVDMDLAQKELEKEIDEKNATILASGATIDALSSNIEFPKLLEALDVEVPTKVSKTTGGDIPAIAKTDEELQELLKHEDPRVVALVKARMAAKSTIGESRANALLYRGADGLRLPIYLVYCGAHTFRWSGGDKFNAQNFPRIKPGEVGLRHCILSPSEDEVLVVVDASQIECRFTAWLFGEEAILDAFREGRDLYSEFASVAYGRVVTRKDKDERFVGKTCILGLGFGMGPPKLQDSILTGSILQLGKEMRLSIEKCRELVYQVYRKMYPRIAQGWDYMTNVGLAAMITGHEVEYKCVKFVKGGIELPSGLTMWYPDLKGDVNPGSDNGFCKTSSTVTNASYKSFYKKTHLWGGLITENIVQAIARICTADAMRKIAEKRRVVMMTHDEVVFVTKKQDADEDLKWAIDIMATPPSWAPDIPLAAEGGYDVKYSK